jgi:transposase
MSYREVSMLEIKEVLRRKEAGSSARRIARDMGIDRKTVGRYLEAIEEAGIGDATEVDDGVLSALSQAVAGRKEVEPSEVWQALARERKQIEAWLLQKPPLRLTRVHELLERGGVFVGYTTLRRYAERELGWHKRAPTVLLADPPLGEEAQVDFGQMGMVTDTKGRRRKLWVLVVTLVCSRYQFIWPTFEQTTEEVCAGMDAAWRFFSGVPKRVVPDNTTSMVLRASPTEPELNRSFREYADARGFLVDPARVRSPKDKPRVENQMPYVRERWFAGELLPVELLDIRRHAEAWCRDIAGARVHGTTRQVPREVYLTLEKPCMQPAPTEPYDLPHWTEAKVHPDHHLQAQRALYSVATRYIGKTVKVRSDRLVVRVYLGAELIKVHPRKGPGERSTDPNDYPPHKAAYALRDVDSLVRRAKEQGSAVGAFCEQLLGGVLPWMKMRQAYGLLRLCERYGAARVNAVCARALEFEVLDVPRLERMLKTAQKVEDEGEKRGQVISLGSRFARDPRSFATMPVTATSEQEKGGAA